MNLGTRVISAAVLIAIAVLAIWFGGYVLLGMVLLAAVIGAYELGCMLRNMEWPGSAGFLALIAGGIYLGVCLGSFVLLDNWTTANADFNSAVLVTVIALVVVCDTAAYFVGFAIGRHKMAPKISPKKTIEGAVGGFAFSILVAAWLGTWLLGLPWFAAASLGFLIAAAATFGDLLESLMKRKAGLKDSGHLIPGHGGLLDRIDGLLLAGPVAYVYLKLIGL